MDCLPTNIIARCSWHVLTSDSLGLVSYTAVRNLVSFASTCKRVRAIIYSFDTGLWKDVDPGLTIAAVSAHSVSGVRQDKLANKLLRSPILPLCIRLSLSSELYDKAEFLVEKMPQLRFIHVYGNTWVLGSMLSIICAKCPTTCHLKADSRTAIATMCPGLVSALQVVPSLESLELGVLLNVELLKQLGTSASKILSLKSISLNTTDECLSAFFSVPHTTITTLSVSLMPGNAESSSYSGIVAAARACCSLEALMVSCNPLDVHVGPDNLDEFWRCCKKIKSIWWNNILLSKPLGYPLGPTPGFSAEVVNTVLQQEPPPSSPSSSCNLMLLLSYGTSKLGSSGHIGLAVRINNGDGPEVNNWIVFTANSHADQGPLGDASPMLTDDLIVEVRFFL